MAEQISNLEDRIKKLKKEMVFLQICMCDESTINSLSEQINELEIYNQQTKINATIEFAEEFGLRHTVKLLTTPLNLISMDGNDGYTTYDSVESGTDDDSNSPKKNACCTIC
jgi:hypothetical protein